ncbi:CpsB/CapC family capsule biosynthesis tyrosine phosphatase [Parapedobacter tibetensis]|uniref:CpsB/CapC family capsule biosynthesis tyrosine phosphatase n=1 Tax=Parapedobacter tibetensis TaxID=2972951 RepID=UPI00214DC378|nr:CpsB/CapC family capsule biosynthesis tyrosine phosphatase [Parapedobacter tibetensis]
MIELLQRRHPFPISRATTVDTGIHLIPDTPEGTSNLASTVQLVGGLTALGIQHFVFTSLVSTEHPTALQTARRVFQQLCEAVDQAGIPSYLSYIPTYVIDDAFEHWVKSHPLETLYGEYVLLGIAGKQHVRELKGPLFEVRARGYQPIIMQREPEQYAKLSIRAIAYLRYLGCFFQLGLTTIIGKHGYRAMTMAERMLAAGYVDFLSTGSCTPEDIHKLEAFATLPKTSKALRLTATRQLELLRGKTANLAPLS